MVAQRFARGQRQADLAVARQLAGAGQHQVAQAGQAGQGQRVAAQAGGQAAHLVQAAGDQAGAGVVAEAQSVGAAGGDGDDVLQRAADRDAGRRPRCCRRGTRPRPGRAAPVRSPRASRPATTAAAGRPWAISAAKVGPENSTTGAPGIACSRTRSRVRRVSASSPFEAQISTAPGARNRRPPGRPRARRQWARPAPPAPRRRRPWTAGR